MPRPNLEVILKKPLPTELGESFTAVETLEINFIKKFVLELDGALWSAAKDQMSI